MTDTTTTPAVTRRARRAAVRAADAPAPFMAVEDGEFNGDAPEQELASAREPEQLEPEQQELDAPDPMAEEPQTRRAKRAQMAGASKTTPAPVRDKKAARAAVEEAARLQELKAAPGLPPRPKLDPSRPPTLRELRAIALHDAKANRSRAVELARAVGRTAYEQAIGRDLKRASKYQRIANAQQAMAKAKAAAAGGGN